MAPLYDDGTYVVTHAVIATPTRYYPLANATARIRRDPLWLAVCFSGICAGAILSYSDLLKPEEILIGAGMALTLLFLGVNVRILSIDAIGHRRTFIFGSTKRITALFRAIRSASSGDLRGLVMLSENDTSHSDQ
jgi:hypothetical protein